MKVTLNQLQFSREELNEMKDVYNRMADVSGEYVGSNIYLSLDGHLVNEINKSIDNGDEEYINHDVGFPLVAATIFDIIKERSNFKKINIITLTLDSGIDNYVLRIS